MKEVKYGTFATSNWFSIVPIIVNLQVIVACFCIIAIYSRLHVTQKGHPQDWISPLPSSHAWKHSVIIFMSKDMFSGVFLWKNIRILIFLDNISKHRKIRVHLDSNFAFLQCIQSNCFWCNGLDVVDRPKWQGILHSHQICRAVGLLFQWRGQIDG